MDYVKNLHNDDICHIKLVWVFWVEWQGFVGNAIMASNLYFLKLNSGFKAIVRVAPMLKFQMIKKTLWSLVMDGVKLSEDYRTITRRQFTFYHSVPSSSWYSTDLPRKDERLSWPWSHPVVLDQESLIQRLNH